MSVELKNWKELCKEKDERIKELEGKFEEIVGVLERKINPLHNPNWNAAMLKAIDVVEYIGGLYERD